MSVSLEMAPPSRRFTPREEAIVKAILAAQSNKEIAGALGISEQSVKNRLTKLYRRFSVNSRLQLMRILMSET
jgi:DNA-binding NarL/FixJ family response regulator